MAKAVILVCAPACRVKPPLLTLRHRPKQFAKNTYGEEEDEDSTVGKLPPSDSEEEE